MSTKQRTGGTSGPARKSEFVERRRSDASTFEDRLWAELDEIPDPHIPVSLVEMAMVYDVSADDGHVDVEMSFPCMGCPAYDMIKNDVRSCLRVVDGVDSVDVDVVWDPVWSKDMLTESVREKMRNSGISL
ncbi:Metal-sulfur cluster biosynthetic enzyme [Halorubrum aquaticum]|uniref:Metal-sulfur cluster biosynthetic enzyme n=2 Tax=Halorubrum TaxID=56688 RepID=A0A521DJJ6_9EURY|nr:MULTISPECIES: iron-sulfur cluster assembly protein [Halorubrum]SFH43752.1 Metal-sulfur cluster biosynthetic enzyme [Halorubrum aquaticum]SMO71090.1 Metal-sulfur cluster biosynthetic enzyme [Halorubrum cibi]